MLQVSQSVEPQQMQAGGTVTYTVQVFNPTRMPRRKTCACVCRSASAADAAGDAKVRMWKVTRWCGLGSNWRRALRSPALVIARLTESLIITASVTGTPITDWVNLSNAVIDSQAIVESDNLATQESHAAIFTVEDYQAQPRNGLAAESDPA
ncbi:MAG: hypothetical protein R2873_04145 [Caldilineaceae bacterium]